MHFVDFSKSAPQGGNEVSVSPVGCPVKQETNRVSQPKRAMRPLQGRRAKIEVAEGVEPVRTKTQVRIIRFVLAFIKSWGAEKKV